MIVIIDLGFTNGHKALNYGYLELLCKFRQIIVMNNGEYYNDLRLLENLTVLDVPFFKIKKSGRFINRIGGVINLLAAYRSLKKLENVEKVIFFTYELLSFSLLGRLFYKYYSTYLFEHNTLDELNVEWKKHFYQVYKNQVIHLVLEEPFMHFLKKEIGVSENRIFTIHHYLREGMVTKVTGDKNLIQIVNLSRSSSEYWIQLMIEQEQNTEFLKKNNIQLCLRSKKQLFDNGNLKIIKGDLTIKEYDEFLSNADAILCIQDGFINRISGSYYDAFSMEKILIANSCPVISLLEQQFPNIVKSFETIEELNHILINLDSKTNEDEIRRIKKRYSHEAIIDDWNRALG